MRRFLLLISPQPAFNSRGILKAMIGFDNCKLMSKKIR